MPPNTEVQYKSKENYGVLPATRRFRCLIPLMSVIFVALLIVYSAFGRLHVSTILCKESSPVLKSISSDQWKSNKSQTNLSSSFVYSLDSECKLDLNDSSATKRKNEFDNIFETGRWGTAGSRSGDGSSIEGAFDWIHYLRSLLRKYPIRSVADIPCGDTYWQFSLRELNTIDGLYFGGDISTSVINQNKIRYMDKHKNKLFQYWDLVRCPVPTYTYKNLTHEIPGNRFDLVIVRDALQHMHIQNALRAVRNVIMSGAKFFALSTYPPNKRSSAENWRSIDKNEPLPTIPSECANKTYCLLGNINDGDFYYNNINCYPFNFPLNKAILVQPSHKQFPMEFDEMHIYPIDDELKKIVKEYDKACQ